MRNRFSAVAQTDKAREMVCRWLSFACVIAVLTSAGPGALGLPDGSSDTSTVTTPGLPSPNWIELDSGWRITSADQIPDQNASVSSPGFDVSRWYAVRHMPATVLQILEDNGVYEDLYYGMNLVAPGDLWKKDWWYRTTFTAPPGREVYSLIFKGINYRADIWVNGQKVADRAEVVGMYSCFEFEVSKLIHSGGENILALKITPERALPGEGRVELGDTWHDWLNWRYIGVHDPETGLGFSFPPDRNAGVWKRVEEDVLAWRSSQEGERSDSSEARTEEEYAFADVFKVP
jgi:Glycosyl hydrolases family 2, sugar binding domain